MRSPRRRPPSQRDATPAPTSTRGCPPSTLGHRRKHPHRPLYRVGWMTYGGEGHAEHSVSSRMASTTRTYAITMQSPTPR